MVPEADRPSTLQQMIAAGDATAPAEQGMPDLVTELADVPRSLAGLLIADRDQDRNR
jgi:hypothetical protein